MSLHPLFPLPSGNLIQVLATCVLGIRALACALLAAAIMSPVSAQTWPDKPIHLVVSTPAGGPIDSLARILGQGVAKSLKQPVIIENRSGASGAIALGHVIKQPADGYTVLITANAAFTLVPILRKMPYKPFENFTFLGQLLFAPDVFAVPATLPAGNMKEFVAFAKSKPGKLNYGLMVGVPQHLDFERFKKDTNTDILFVPYPGGGPILNALIAGEIDATLLNAPLVAPWVKSGKLRALAATSATRAASMPDVPTLAEAGYPGMTLSGGSYYSLAAPAGLPKDIASKLAAAFSASASDPDTRSKLVGLGFELNLREGAALKRELEREFAANEILVKKLDIKITD